MNATLSIPSSPVPVTELLARLASGDRPALDQLFERVYAELRRLASGQLYRLRPGDTLGTTVLVHEAYLKLVGAEQLAAADQHHFFSLAARAMRQILLDEVRRRSAQRRPDPHLARCLDDTDIPVQAPLEDLLAIDAALTRLDRLDPNLGRLVEWRVFAGLTIEEIAPLAARSTASLKRDWRKARAFLARELGPTLPASGAP